MATVDSLARVAEGVLGMQLEIAALKANQEKIALSWKKRKDQIPRMDAELKRLRGEVDHLKATLAAHQLLPSPSPSPWPQKKIPYDPRGPSPHFSTPSFTPSAASQWRWDERSEE